jgi:hypothetical protein
MNANEKDLQIIWVDLRAFAAKKPLRGIAAEEDLGDGLEQDLAVEA